MVLFKLVFQRVVHALVYRDILPPLKLEDAVSEVYLAIVQVFARYVDAVDVCVRAGRVRQVGLDGRAAFAHPQLVDYAELGARATVHGTYDGLLRPFGGVVFLCLADLFGRVTVYFFHVPVETIGSKYPDIGTDLFHPALPVWDLSLVIKVLPSAFTIAFRSFLLLSNSLASSLNLR